MTVGGTSDHGPENHPLGGTIMAMPLDRNSEPRVYARGLRNAFDLTFCPDGRLYASDNGPDQMDLPVEETYPDEVNLILEGGHYGYPNYFGVVPASTGTISPVALLPVGSGSTGIVCHQGDAFGEDYAGDLFVALWGTFTQEIETGRSIVRVQLEETESGVIRGTTTEFMMGFSQPIAIAQDTHGTLLVLDYDYGQVWRISYEPDSAG
jgi:glucose/arabinose dehydrogenase